MNIGDLNARVKLDTTAFQKGINKMTRGFSDFGAMAVKLNQTVELLGRGFNMMEQAAQRCFGTFVQAANVSEKYRVRLNILLGSQKEGARMFKEMSTFAAGVPFEYEKIMESATALSGVMDGGVEGIKNWMPMISDLAAVSGLSIEDTTGQIIRMYSAGAASADMFRERGITAMLGFTAGVQYTAEETREMLMDAFNSPTSKFKGASKELAKTWDGLLSMMNDRWFLFRNQVMDSGLFESMKMRIQWILDKLNQWAADGSLSRWAERTARNMVTGINIVLGAIKYLMMAYKGLDAAFVGVMELGSKFVETLYADLARLSDGVMKLINAMIRSINKVRSFFGTEQLQELPLSNHWWNKAEAAQQKTKIWKDMRQEAVAEISEISYAFDKLFLKWDGKPKAATDGPAGVPRPKSKSKPEPAGEENTDAADARKELATMLADAKWGQGNVGLEGLELEIRRINKAADDLKVKYGDMFADDLELAPMIERYRQLQIETAKATDEFEKQQAEAEKLAEKMEALSYDISDAFESLDGPLEDFLTKLAQTGSFAFGEMVQGMLKSLQALAAQKTAEMLIHAAHQGVMGLVYSAMGNSEMAGKAYAAASAALASAGTFGAFVAGSGLAGMAHSGIDSIPKEGTWLLDKGERVVDSDTNRDLKGFLSGGGRGDIHMDVTINGGDEKSVLKALPALKTMILETVNGDIANNGQTRKTIMNYT